MALEVAAPPVELRLLLRVPEGRPLRRLAGGFGARRGASG